MYLEIMHFYPHFLTKYVLEKALQYTCRRKKKHLNRNNKKKFKR